MAMVARAKAAPARISAERQIASIISGAKAALLYTSSFDTYGYKSSFNAFDMNDILIHQTDNLVLKLFCYRQLFYQIFAC